MQLLIYFFPSIFFFTMSFKVSYLLRFIFQLKFEGIRGSSYTGDAAIDDVVLKKCGGGGGGGCGRCLKTPLPITKMTNNRTLQLT